jgi:hypothetical protein
MVLDDIEVDKNGKCCWGEVANAAYEIEHEIKMLRAALTDTLCELTACANQLAARGLPGREGDSVSRAQKTAREILALTSG